MLTKLTQRSRNPLIKSGIMAKFRAPGVIFRRTGILYKMPENDEDFTKISKKVNDLEERAAKYNWIHDALTVFLLTPIVYAIFVGLMYWFISLYEWLFE